MPAPSPRPFPPAELPFRPYLVGARPAPAVESTPFPTLDDAMRSHIGEALKRTSGRIEGPLGAAALLGLNPHTLRGKMRKLRIDWAAYRR